MSEKQGVREGMALEVLREGDALLLWKLDRLGHSLKQLIVLIGDLEKRGVHFKSLTESIDTHTYRRALFFTWWPA